jgi:hypothetical protein
MTESIEFLLVNVEIGNVEDVKRTEDLCQGA